MTARSPFQVHATAVAVAADADGPLAGVLLLGRTGAGKSALALSLIEGCPFRRTALIGDDQVLIDSSGVAVGARALKGLIEVRGFGPAHVRAVDCSTLVLAADLDLEAERVPTPLTREAAPGVAIPHYPFRWAGAEGTAAHRLRVIVRQVLCGQNGEEPQDAALEGVGKPA